MDMKIEDCQKMDIKPCLKKSPNYGHENRGLPKNGHENRGLPKNGHKNCGIFFEGAAPEASCKGDTSPFHPPSYTHMPDKTTTLYSSHENNITQTQQSAIFQSYLRHIVLALYSFSLVVKKYGIFVT